jgi:4,5-dihydroxyphthalate decarboxylase
MSVPLRLRAAIAPYPHVRALLDGSVRSERVAFDFVEVTPITRGFRRMVRTLEFDLCEMAVVTLAQAHAYEKPIAGLSAVVLRGFHHGALVCLNESPIRGPADLPGRRVGVRAWSQTTGVWVRGILRSEYGVDAARMSWITGEDAHLAEFRDPPWVSRAPAGTGLATMLHAGLIDAGIALGDVTAATRTVIPDASAAAAEWYRRTGIYPVNHVIAVKRSLLAEYDWLAGELMALLTAARQLAPPAPHGPVGDDPLPYGLGANRTAINALVRFAAEQRLIPRAYTAEELFVM